jgi:hypothetical protein
VFPALETESGRFPTLETCFPGNLIDFGPKAVSSVRKSFPKFKEQTHSERLLLSMARRYAALIRGKGKGAVHMASVFSDANGVALSQVNTTEKPNEITAIPQLLKLLNLPGCLVTIVAMGVSEKDRVECAS